MPDKLYDVLKWIALIALPATATLWFTIAKIWGLPYMGEITGTIVAVDTFLGALLGISNLTYKRMEANYDSEINESGNNE